MHLFSKFLFFNGSSAWRRKTQESLFRVSGLVSLSLVMGLLCLLVALVCLRGYTAFLSTEIHMTLHFPEPLTLHNIHHHTHPTQWRTHLAQALSKEHVFLTQEALSREATQIFSWSGHNTLQQTLQKKIKREGALQQVNLWVLASDEADNFYKGQTLFFSYDQKRLTQAQALTLHELIRKGKIRLKWNKRFLTGNNSSLPEFAGLWGAFIGSLWTLLVALLFSFPLGLGAGLYLEEIAPSTRGWAWIDVQLNNLASIPSILFGLLTFMLFDYWFHIPRPSALLGGLAIGMMMAPLLMVTTRVALQTVPHSIRAAARALGATEIQILWDHVLPLAFPQMIAGALLTSVRALGETAPVLMVGMVAFVGNTPHGVTSPATTLPAQVFSWSKSPELGFLTKTSGGMLALFFLLFILNGLAFWLRRQVQKNR